MITYNYMTNTAIAFRGTSQATRVKTYDGTMSTTGGGYIPNSFKGDLNYTNYPDSNWDGCYLLIGSGDSPETPESYKLDSVITQYSVINQTHTFSDKYGGSVLLINRVIQNTSEEAFTVKEMGLFGANYMIAREVLDKPETLQPGEKHTFTMAIGLE